MIDATLKSMIGNELERLHRAGRSWTDLVTDCADMLVKSGWAVQPAELDVLREAVKDALGRRGDTIAALQRLRYLTEPNHPRNADGG